MKISPLVLCLPLLLALPKGSFGQAAPQARSGDPVATVAGQPISEEELQETLGPQQSMQLRMQEYEAKSKALDSLIRLKLVQAEAKKRSISAEKKIESTLHELLTKYSGRVKLAYLDFPLREIHPQAQRAAEAARCAGEQGKFWEYHDALYAEQSKLDGAELLTRARALNLDEKSFQSCLNSGKFKSKIEADL